MALRVLIVPDKFKGTLTAAQAAQAIADGWLRNRPQDHLELLPMSDGGDGFGAVMSQLLEAEPQSVETVDAAHRPLKSTWWWEPKRRLAIIESAQVVGLALLPHRQFHPFELDTFGLGKVLTAAAEVGARKCLVGIGGSATNEAGFGLAKSLGWEFADHRGQSIASWIQLHALRQILPPRKKRWFAQLTVAVDVQNPLLGKKGASRIYGPQKGLTPADFQPAERCLRQLSSCWGKSFGTNHAKEPGAGAAGGLGFGLATFLGARLQPGFDLFARCSSLASRLEKADLVITGEGAIDASSLMGKGVGQVARMCFERGIPCLGMAGVLGNHNQLSHLFTRAHCLAPDLTTPELAQRAAARWLAELANRVAAGWQSVD